MFQTSGDPWTADEKAALERYQQAGGGIVAVHNATDMRGNYAWWDDMMAMDLREAARGVRIPWRVAHGARSRVYPPAAAEWLAGGSAAATRVPFGRSGHSPHLEEPAAFARMLCDFDAELAGA